MLEIGTVQASSEYMLKFNTLGLGFNVEIEQETALGVELSKGLRVGPRLGSRVAVGSRLGLRFGTRLELRQPQRLSE